MSGAPSILVSSKARFALARPSQPPTTKSGSIGGAGRPARVRRRTDLKTSLSLGSSEMENSLVPCISMPLESSM